VWIAHLNVPIQDCSLKLCVEANLFDSSSIKFCRSMSPFVADHFHNVVECVNSSSFLGLLDFVNTYVLLS
jgi:hypothetical protein